MSLACAPSAARPDRSHDRSNRARPLLRLSGAIPLAVVLATAMPGTAFAQCTGLCQDQATLLWPFGTFLNSPAGMAVLIANMQTEESIYANASAARRVLATENSLVQYAGNNVLIAAFPNNPNYYFNADGTPSAATTATTSVTTAVGSVVNLLASGAVNGDLKNYFGQINVYGIAYGNTTADPNGDPRPFQTSGAIAGNPFTPANSSQLAYQIQQTLQTTPYAQT